MLILGLRLNFFDAVQVIELPYRASGAPPARRGLESLDGVVAWVDGHHTWLPNLTSSGVPAVNCGGDWNPSEKLAVVAVNMASLLDLAVSHCRELSIPRLKFIGEKVSNCEGRIKLVEALESLSAPCGIEAGFF